MKWRNSLVYLILFLLIGGYYGYFEVVRKEQKEAAEKEAKRLLHFETEDLRNLEILAKDKKRLRLEKEEQWRIVEPVKAGVESGVLQDFMRSLARLDFEKSITASAQDLKPYGLADPALKIRWQAGEKWMELLLGDRNPTGDGHYARTSEKPDVYLVSAGVWSALNKNLDELRKKELLSFQPKDVRALQVSWDDGGSVNVEFREEEDLWKSPERPERKIKNSKVNNILEQLNWLRAKSFLDNESTNLKKYCLDTPLVTVKLKLKENKDLELRLSRRDKDQNALVALSTELPGIVLIDSYILKDLPKNGEAIEDRSLLGVKREEIRQVKWRMGESAGHAVETGENNWSLKRDDKDQEPLKESWPVRSLLWDLADAEYQEKLDEEPLAPVEPHGRLEIWSRDSSLIVFEWEKRSEKDPGPVTLWVEQEGKTELVHVKAEVISKVEENLSRIMQAGSDKKGF